LPSTPEWIWTNLKLAKMLLHFTPMLTRWGATGTCG
jgi:hypothetical protein